MSEDRPTADGAGVPGCGASLPASQARWRAASWVLLAVAVLAAIVCFDDAGISWDEGFHRHWGDEKLDFYLGVLTGEHGLDAARELKGSIVHPGLYDMLLAAVRRVSPLGWYRTNHLLTAFTGLLGVFAVWKTGRLLGGEKLAFWSAVVLLCTPRYVGHAWFNPKDLPFAVAYAWSVYFLVKVLTRLPRARWQDFAGLGIATGAALGVRNIPGLLIPCYTGLGIVLFLVSRAWSARLSASGLAGMAGLGPMRLGLKCLNLEATFWRRLGLCVAVAAGFALMLALPANPGFWLSTSDHGGSGLGEALEHAQDFDWRAPVLFNGAHIMSNELPRTYLHHWLLITLPELQLVCLALAGGFGLWRLKTSFGPGLLAGHRLGWLMVGVGALFPLAYVFATRPTLYDGMRHFLFVLPVLALLGAWGLCAGWAAVRARFGGAPAARWLPAVPGLLCAVIGFEYIQLHPFQYVYFNSLVGGLRGAYGQYETDYWGVSYKEAVGRLVETVAAQVPGGALPPARVVLARTAAPWSAKPFLPPQWHLVDDPAVADFALTYTRMGDHLLFQDRGQVIGYVSRKGVPLNILWYLGPPQAPAAAPATDTVPDTEAFPDAGVPTQK